MRLPGKKVQDERPQRAADVGRGVEIHKAEIVHLFFFIFTPPPGRFAVPSKL